MRSKGGYITKIIRNPQAIFPDVLYAKCSYTVPLDMATSSGTGGVIQRYYNGSDPIRGRFLGGTDYERSYLIQFIQGRYEEYYVTKSAILVKFTQVGVQNAQVCLVADPLQLTLTGEELMSLPDSNGKWKCKAVRVQTNTNSNNQRNYTLRHQLPTYKVHGVPRMMVVTDNSFHGNVGAFPSVGTPPTQQVEWNLFMNTIPEGTTATHQQIQGSVTVTHYVRFFKRVIENDTTQSIP